MSNVDMQEPVVTADSVQEETVVTVSRVKPKRTISKIMIFGAIVLTVFALWSFLSPKRSEVESAVQRPPNMNTTAGGATVETSAAYRESLRQANEQNAARALEKGETFLPTPESILTPLENTQETLPEAVVEPEKNEPEPVVVRKRAVVPQLKKVNEAAPQPTAQAQANNANNQQEPENPFIGLIGAQMGAFSGSLVPPESRTEELAVNEEPNQAEASVQQSDDQLTDEERMQVASADTSNPNSRAGVRQRLTAAQRLTADQQPLNGVEGLTDETTNVDLNGDGIIDVVRNGQGDNLIVGQDGETIDNLGQDGQINVLRPQDQKRTDKVYVAAGDLLYGEVVASVNSDAPLPVIAQVTTGKHKGARVKGTFTPDAGSGKLIVTFSQMTKGDITVPITAVAVDGFTADSTVRSGIERRYLRRYGTVFAATFIEGLAAGKAEPEKTIIEDEDGEQQVVEEKRTTEQSFWLGVQNSVASISDDLKESTPKGPKIYLNSVYPVGILFLDDLREDPDTDEEK